MFSPSPSYLAYRADTEVVTSWICLTGEDHGNTIVSTRPIDPPGARAGRRPRGGKVLNRWLAARDAAAVVEAADTTADGRPLYDVSSAEILRQAIFLSQLDHTIVMPRAVWNAYKRTLAARRKRAAKSVHKEEDGDENDDGGQEEGENSRPDENQIAGHDETDDHPDGQDKSIEVLVEAGEYIKDVVKVQKSHHRQRQDHRARRYFCPTCSTL
jgi:hypothetical protein